MKANDIKIGSRVLINYKGDNRQCIVKAINKKFNTFTCEIPNIATLHNQPIKNIIKVRERTDK